jgi:hypothetical protein
MNRAAGIHIMRAGHSKAIKLERFGRARRIDMIQTLAA